MSEMSFEQMLEESLKTIRNGEVVEGTVIDVKPDEIILNIGYKSDGIITRNEYTNEPNVDLTTVVKAGDTLEAKVVKVNDGEGQVLLSYKRLAAEKGNKRLEEAFENQEILNEIRRILTVGGRLIFRVNSVNDVNHGAGQGNEIEHHLYETSDKRLKRFFDEKDIKFFFKDFDIEYLNEEIMTRYKLEKRLYRVCVRKK